MGKIAYLLIVLFFLWLGWSYIKRNRADFSGDKIAKSSYHLGWLTVLLIGLIGLMILILKRI